MSAEFSFAQNHLFSIIEQTVYFDHGKKKTLKLLTLKASEF